MDMLEELLKELASGSQSFEFLSRRMNRLSFAELIHDDGFMNSARGLMASATVSVVDLFGGTRLVTLATWAGWSALITSHNSVVEQVHSHTGLIGLVNLTSNQASTLDIYRIEGISAADPLKAKTLRLGDSKTIAIERLPPFVPDDMDSLYSIRNRADRSIWLVIAGPSNRPYFHAFSTESHRYLYSAFPSNGGASAHYLSELLKQYVCASNGPTPVQSAVVALGRVIAELDVTPSTGKWNVAQALSRIAPDDAWEILDRLAQDGNGIGDRARELIQRHDNRHAAP